jgi:hypothetical protein
MNELQSYSIILFSAMAILSASIIFYYLGALSKVQNVDLTDLNKYPETKEIFHQERSTPYITEKQKENPYNRKAIPYQETGLSIVKRKG